MLETILNYFLAQQVKAKEKGNKDRQKYVDQTLTLHQLIVKLMKCKQTVDQRNCSDAYSLLISLPIYILSNMELTLKNLEKKNNIKYLSFKASEFIFWGFFVFRL